MIQLFVSKLVTPCVGFQYSNTNPYSYRGFFLLLLPVLAKNRMLGVTARKQANRLSKFEVYSEGGRNKRLVRRLRLFLFVAIGAAMMGGLSAIVYNQATSTFSVCYYSYIKTCDQYLFKLNAHGLLFISQRQHFSAAVSQLLWVRVVINMLDITVVDTSFKTRRLMGELSTFKSREMERSWVTAPAMV